MTYIKRADAVAAIDGIMGYAANPIIEAINALPSVTVDDAMVWEAHDAYEKEFKAWRIVPDISSRYNDRGVIRYKCVHVVDDCRHSIFDCVSDVPETTSFRRLHMEADSAKSYVAWESMKAALLAAMGE